MPMLGVDQVALGGVQGVEYRKLCRWRGHAVLQSGTHQHLCPKQRGKIFRVYIGQLTKNLNFTAMQRIMPSEKEAQALAHTRIKIHFSNTPVITKHGVVGSTFPESWLQGRTSQGQRASLAFSADEQVCGVRPRQPPQSLGPEQGILIKMIQILDAAFQAVEKGTIGPAVAAPFPLTPP